jgi:hypothetical protein
MSARSERLLRSTQETADQVEAPPSAVANEPILDETRRVADELSMGADLGAPNSLAPAQVLLCIHIVGLTGHHRSCS